MSKKWYPPYKCQYCYNKLYNKDYLYKVHSECRERKIDKLLYFNCPDCRATFQYSVLTGKTLQATFYIGEGRIYKAFMNYQNPLFEVEYYKHEPNAFLFGTEKVISLNYIPRNWSPKTAPEKLKLYLLFS